ncbi:hypothetical protein MPSEU_000666200 [Mayamaea pseudoterrestris]|nr:hypothetical protein MPSEU_000666200 [Mayamaea pseudoterrestris]
MSGVMTGYPSEAIDGNGVGGIGRSSSKGNEAVYLNGSNHGAYASEEEWAMEMNDTLGLGNWFETAAAARDQDSAAAAAHTTATITKAESKASIHHGPSSRRTKKKKGMPKRPLSAYNLFFQKERVRIYEQSSGRVSFEELGKTIGQRWKSLSEEDRREYDDLAEGEVNRYRVERDAYDDMRRKTLEYRDTDHDLHDKLDSSPWLTDGETKEGDSLATSQRSSKRAPYLFKPHDVDAPLPHTSLPPGMLVSLRDPDGREQSYKIEYKCFRMTRKDAEEYMDRLNEQVETGQVK